MILAVKNGFNQDILCPIQIRYIDTYNTYLYYELPNSCPIEEIKTKLRSHELEAYLYGDRQMYNIHKQDINQHVNLQVSLSQIRKMIIGDLKSVTEGATLREVLQTVNDRPLLDPEILLPIIEEYKEDYLQHIKQTEEDLRNIVIENKIDNEYLRQLLNISIDE